MTLTQTRKDMFAQSTNPITMPMNLDKFLNLLGCEIQNTQNAIYNLKILAKENSIDPKNMNLRQKQNLWMLLNIALEKDENETSQEDNNQSLSLLETKLMQYAKLRHNKFKIVFVIFYFLNFTALFVPLVLKHIYPQKTFFNYTSYLAILLSLFSVNTLFVCSYKLSSSFRSKVDEFTCGINFNDAQQSGNKPKPPV